MPVLMWCLHFAPGLVRGGLRDFALVLALWGAGLGLVWGCGTDDGGLGRVSAL